jgi:hypothetical protein
MVILVKTPSQPLIARGKPGSVQVHFLTRISQKFGAPYQGRQLGKVKLIQKAIDNHSSCFETGATGDENQV